MIILFPFYSSILPPIFYPPSPFPFPRSTYVYCRANKSVSLAAPAYYAHWASKRGKVLTQAGATADDLLRISRTWGEAGRTSTMFFV